MRSTPVGEDAHPPGRADPRGPVLLVVAGALLAASAVLDLGYYAPPRDGISAGAAVASGPGAELARNRAVVKIVPEMALRPGTKPTLSDAIRFFGLEEEVLRCSALATAEAEEGEGEIDERRAQALERQARSPGDSVTLCLD